MNRTFKFEFLITFREDEWVVFENNVFCTLIGDKFEECVERPKSIAYHRISYFKDSLDRMPDNNTWSFND